MQGFQTIIMCPKTENKHFSKCSVSGLSILGMRLLWIQYYSDATFFTVTKNVIIEGQQQGVDYMPDNYIYQISLHYSQ